MHPIAVMILVFAGYIFMYHLYGKFISKLIFRVNEKSDVAATNLQDGFDYVPSKKGIVFSHHFSSIAGTGPIIGPAIAIIWGWVPAVLWVFFGSIFIGAVHDFGILIVSMRNKGYSIAEITGIYLSRRTKIFLFLIGLLELWIFIAILGLVIAIIFDMYPGAVLTVWLEIPIAILLGYLVMKQGASYRLWSLVALLVMYLTVIFGYYFPVNLTEIGGIPATGLWTIILLVYAFIASVLPITTLMQPRDSINAHQLLVAMGLLIIGVVIVSLTTNFVFVAPAYDAGPTGAPSMWPFLFIIIACGAVSGFHALVSSGTSSKQVTNEKDALFVGYGSMLTEGALALLVIIAVGAGLGLGFTTPDGEVQTGLAAWGSNYSSWAAASGMAGKLAAFVEGSANIITSLGIPKSIAILIMGVFVASFAGTSLDTAVRMQRYFLQELFGKKKFANKNSGEKKNMIDNTYFATFLVVVSAALLAFSTGFGGEGALLLWPLFGKINQILAALGLIVLSIYLKNMGGKKWIITAVPAVFMSIITLWAAIKNQIEFFNQTNILLMLVNGLIVVLAVWVMLEAEYAFFRKNKNFTK